MKCFFENFVFFMHVYVNLNITTSIIIVLKNLKNGQKIQKIVVIQHKLLLCGVLPIGKVWNPNYYLQIITHSDVTEIFKSIRIFFGESPVSKQCS